MQLKLRKLCAMLGDEGRERLRVSDHLPVKESFLTLLKLRKDPSTLKQCKCGWMLFPEPPPSHCLNPKCPNFRKPTFGFKGD